MTVPDGHERKPQAASDLLLKSTRSGAPKTIVLSRKSAVLGGRRRVYGPVMVEQVNLRTLAGPAREGRWEAAGRDVPCGYVIAEEAFFPPKLIELKQSDKALSAGATNLSLPLTPRFFRYFKVEDVRDRRLLTVQVGEKQVTVRLRLPLKGGEGRHVVLEKAYQKDGDIVQIQTAVPALGFWPDFFAEDWPDNFAIYYDDAHRANVRYAPVVAGGLELPPSDDSGEEQPLRLWPTQRPVLGYHVYQRDHERDSLVSLGMIVRKDTRPPAPVARGRTWIVAVDFDPEQTHLMVDTGTGSPRPLNLKARTTLLTEVIKSVETAISYSTHPTQDVPTPFPTLLGETASTIIGDGSRRDQGRGETLDLQNTAIGAQRPVFLFSALETTGAQRRQMIRNVKWGAGGAAHSDRALKSYLRGVTSCIMAEAKGAGVDTMELRWSYPLLLPISARNAMRAFWEASAHAFLPATPRIRTTRGVARSEAVARQLVAICPSDFPARSDALCVAVDVGSETTDVSYWTNHRLLDHISLHLGMNDILGPLGEDDSFVAGFYRACFNKDISDEVREAFRERPEIMFNAALSQAVDSRGSAYKDRDPNLHPFVTSLFTKLPNGEEPWVWGRTMVYAMFSGIAFYIGLHSRKYVSDAHKEAYLYWGGKGSSLLTWASNVPNRTERMLSETFLRGLSHEAPHNREFQVRSRGAAIAFSTAMVPGQLVAPGMLAPELTSSADADARAAGDLTIVGEKGYRRSDGAPVDWDTAVTAGDLYHLEVPATFAGCYLSEYLADVAPRHIEELLLDGQLWRTRVQRAQMQQAIREAVKTGQMALQPIFAFELKALLEAYRGKVGL